MPWYGGEQFLYSDYWTLDLDPQRLFERRRMKRVSGVADARRDVKLQTHDAHEIDSTVRQEWGGETWIIREMGSIKTR